MSRNETCRSGEKPPQVYSNRGKEPYILDVIREMLKANFQSGSEARSKHHSSSTLMQFFDWEKIVLSDIHFFHANLLPHLPIISHAVKGFKDNSFSKECETGKKTFETYGGCCLEQLNEKYRDVDFLILMQNNLDIHSFHKPSIQLQGSSKQCNQIFSGTISNETLEFQISAKDKKSFKV